MDQHIGNILLYRYNIYNSSLSQGVVSSLVDCITTGYYLDRLSTKPSMEVNRLQKAMFRLT